MRLCDHTVWDCEDTDFGKNHLHILAEHFAEPLAQHNFNLDLALKELNGVKRVKQMKYKGYQNKYSFWEKMFEEYHSKFPHFFLIIELSLVMSFSSSTVERGFSTLKRHLTDSRLSLTNSTLNDLLLLRINSPVLKRLDPSYESKLIQKAVHMYLNSPKLKRGRYNRTFTQESAKDVQGEGNGTTPDLFLPISASTFTESQVEGLESLNPLLMDMDVDVDIDNSDYDNLTVSDDDALLFGSESESETDHDESELMVESESDHTVL